MPLMTLNHLQQACRRGHATTNFIAGILRRTFWNLEMSTTSPEIYKQLSRLFSSSWKRSTVMHVREWLEFWMCAHVNTETIAADREMHTHLYSLSLWYITQTISYLTMHPVWSDLIRWPRTLLRRWDYGECGRFGWWLCLYLQGKSTPPFRVHIRVWLRQRCRASSPPINYGNFVLSTTAVNFASWTTIKIHTAMAPYPPLKQSFTKSVSLYSLYWRIG